MKILFKEKQKFTQWWIWFLLGFIFHRVIIQRIIDPILLDNQPINLSDWILSLIIVAVIIFIFIINLKTEIDKDEIRVHFFPFVKKRLKWSEIKSAKVINYGFVGGWGIRFSTKYGTIYNVKGKKGLAIELLNGKKLVIGTQKEQELTKIVQEIGVK